MPATSSFVQLGASFGFPIWAPCSYRFTKRFRSDWTRPFGHPKPAPVNEGTIPSIPVWTEPDMRNRQCCRCSVVLTLRLKTTKNHLLRIVYRCDRLGWRPYYSNGWHTGRSPGTAEERLRRAAGRRGKVPPRRVLGPNSAARRGTHARHAEGGQGDRCQ